MSSRLDVRRTIIRVLVVFAFCIASSVLCALVQLAMQTKRLTPPSVPLWQAYTDSLRDPLVRWVAGTVTSVGIAVSTPLVYFATQNERPVLTAVSILAFVLLVVVSPVDDVMGLYGAFVALALACAAWIVGNVLARRAQTKRAEP